MKIRRIALALLFLTGAAQAVELPGGWNTPAGNNSFAPPNGWPENMAPSDVNNTARENMAVIARWATDESSSLVATGAINAYQVTSVRGISTLYDGIKIAFTATDGIATNTTGVTINVDSSGAKPIKLGSDAELTSGAIQPGQRIEIVYDAESDWWQILSALSGGSGDVLAANNLSEYTATAATARGNINAVGTGFLLNTTAPLTGGGDLSATRTLLIDLSAISATSVFSGASDLVLVRRNSDGVNVAGTINDILSGSSTVPVFLGTFSTSAGTSLNVSGVFSSTYKTYVIEAQDIVTGTDGSDLMMRFSVSGAFKVDVADYGYILTQIDGNGSNTATETNVEDTSGTGMFMHNPARQGLGTGTNEKAMATIKIFNPVSGNVVMGSWELSMRNADGGNKVRVSGMGEYKGGTSAVDGVQLLMDSGTITGSVNVWGYR